MNEITTSCGNCWFYSNGQCLYAGKCTASMKWSNTLNQFVPITYIENDKVDTTEALYNANWRIIGDDEIVLKKSQYEAEKEKAFLEWREEYDQNCLLRLRVSELEKELEKLKAQNETLELNNKKLKQTNDEFVKANKAFAKRNEELLDELQELTDIKAKTEKETATEILQVVDKRLDLYRNGVIGGSLYDSGYKEAVNEIKHSIATRYVIE